MTRLTRYRMDQKMNRSFALDRSRAKLLGVCSGLANYFNIDPMFLRVGFVAGTIIFGLPAVLYFVIALVAD